MTCSSPTRLPSFAHSFFGSRLFFGDSEPHKKVAPKVKRRPLEALEAFEALEPLDSEPKAIGRAVGAQLRTRRILAPLGGGLRGAGLPTSSR